MLIKVAEKKINRALAMLKEARDMTTKAEGEVMKVSGEIYDVADGMRSQATELDLMADNLVAKNL